MASDIAAIPILPFGDATPLEPPLIFSLSRHRYAAEDGSCASRAMFDMPPIFYCCRRDRHYALPPPPPLAFAAGYAAVGSISAVAISLRRLSRFRRRALPPIRYRCQRQPRSRYYDDDSTGEGNDSHAAIAVVSAKRAACGAAIAPLRADLPPPPPPRRCRRRHYWIARLIRRHTSRCFTDAAAV